MTFTGIFNFTLAKEPRTVGLFQVNRGVQVVYNESRASIESLTFKGAPVEDEATFSVCVQDYFYNSAETQLGLTKAGLDARGTKVVATSIVDMIEEYLRHHQNLNGQVEGRIVFR